MIENKTEYIRYIQEKGVGSNDKVASSPDSYISYLQSVSSILVLPISAITVKCDADVERIVVKLRTLKARSDKTINNYRSALRQYAAMVEEKSL